MTMNTNWGEVLDVMLRSIISLVSLFLVTKALGKKQVSQLSAKKEGQNTNNNNTTTDDNTNKNNIANNQNNNITNTQQKDTQKQS